MKEGHRQILSSDVSLAMSAVSLDVAMLSATDCRHVVRHLAIFQNLNLKVPRRLCADARLVAQPIGDTRRDARHVVRRGDIHLSTVGDPEV